MYDKDDYGIIGAQTLIGRVVLHGTMLREGAASHTIVGELHGGGDAAKPSKLNVILRYGVKLDSMSHAEAVLIELNQMLKGLGEDLSGDLNTFYGRLLRSIINKLVNRTLFQAWNTWLLPLRELQMIERQQRLMFKILTRIDNYQLARDFDFWRGWARKDAQEARIRAGKQRALRRMANAALSKGWEAWMMHYRSSLRAQQKIARAGLSSALSDRLEQFQQLSAARMHEMHQVFLRDVQKEIGLHNENMTFHAGSFVQSLGGDAFSEPPVLVQLTLAHASLDDVRWEHMVGESDGASHRVLVNLVPERAGGVERATAAFASQAEADPRGAPLVWDETFFVPLSTKSVRLAIADRATDRHSLLKARGFADVTLAELAASSLDEQDVTLPLHTAPKFGAMLDEDGHTISAEHSTHDALSLRWLGVAPAGSCGAPEGPAAAAAAGGADDEAIGEIVVRVLKGPKLAKHCAVMMTHGVACRISLAERGFRSDALSSALFPGPPTEARHNKFLWVTPTLTHIQWGVTPNMHPEGRLAVADLRDVEPVHASTIGGHEQAWITLRTNEPGKTHWELVVSDMSWSELNRWVAALRWLLAAYTLGKVPLNLAS